MRSLLVAGMGLSAQSLAARLDRSDWRILGTTRSQSKAQKLRRQGVEPVLFDGSHPLADSVLEAADALLVSIPPDEDGDAVLRAHPDLARHRFDWVGYLSTTGVYGDRQGDWVDEDSPLKPTGVRGQRRVAAEQAWLDLGAQSGSPVQLFRLAGIYGPGRNALVSVQTGQARRIVKPGQLFSRVHSDDIAQVLAASLDRPAAGRAYNVCDDEAAPPQDVIAYAADLLGVAPPPEIPFAQADLSPMARSFYADNKRVRNDRIKQELGVRLLYPSYREGLRALLAEGG